jgi:ATP-binding cassette, subfamily B, bacterial MsbA
VLTYGGFQIIDGEKTVGAFMAFFPAMALMFEPLRRLGSISGSWSAASAGLGRVRDLMDQKASILSPSAPLALPNAASADIRFDNVQFAYGNQPALNGASFTAKAGQTTALVGASGAGKTTVFHLLSRLADPQSGTISIGGITTQKLDLVALRDTMSVVSQDTLLFDEPIRDNILMGHVVPDIELQIALHSAHVDDFLPRLDKGLDTMVGPRGSALSGGQRQRVAIARALLRDRPILLLDEATSALDAASEAAVQDALLRLSKGRTTLVIAHRLSTIKDADNIIVMDRGRVVEQGRHTELLAKGGVYSGLYKMQFAEA